jgi:MFS transporter, PPP family, 3-phenylpropionic acid transporter
VTSLALARRRLPVAVDLSMAAPAIVYVALFGAIGTWFPYQSVLLASRGLDLAAIGLLLALSGVVALVAAPIWGAIADRAGEIRRSLFAASVVAGVGAAWLALAGDAWSVAGGLSVMAFGLGGMIPLADTRTLEFAGESRDRFGRARAFGSAAFIATAIVTGSLISGRSPDALFLLYVPMLLVTGVASWRLFAPRPGAETGRSLRRGRTGPTVAGFVALLKRPGLFALLVGTTLVWTAVGAVMAFISIHVAAMGADLVVVGLMSAAGALVEVPIMLAFPALAARFGAERLLVLGAVAFALRAALWALAPSPELALAVAPLGGVGFALFYVGLVTFVAKSVPSDVQATAQGVYSGMTFSLGTVVGSALAGAAAPILGLPGLFAVAAVATVAGAIVVARGVALAGERQAPASALAIAR